ncbi:MAG TPA: hypothetical protein VFN13_02555 [Rudaea sp.]|nr:hypothetical protein [Rudaea sp.]
MRWVLLVIATFGFGLGFSAKTPGVMGIGLLIGFVGLFASLLLFAAARIAANSRPDSALLTDKEISLLRASLKKNGSKPASSSSLENP